MNKHLHSYTKYVTTRQSSKIRMKKHLKTLNKLRKKEIVDDKYVYVRKNAFYNHIKDSPDYINDSNV